MIRRLVAGATLALVACSVGVRSRGYEPAQHPAGVQVTVVTIMPERLQGELLAVDDTAVTMHTQSLVWVVPYSTIRYINVRQGGRISLGRRPPEEREREDLRLRSRFPQGMDAALRARVLAAYGQDSLAVARP